MIRLPNELAVLLEGSAYKPALENLLGTVGTLLADNQMVFFPNFTDHGTSHIEAVLRSEVELIPRTVFDQSRAISSPRVLCDADAVVLIAATLFHDLAMHLTVPGFRELIEPGSRFRPLPWFRERQVGHRADLSWSELWDEFSREAKRFGDRALGDVVGLESVRDGWRFEGLPADPGQWQANHKLVIGEFIRRHHARLAHEIAMYGFHGLPVDQFPALGQVGHPLRDLADLIGVTARSHGTSLRLCCAYITAIHGPQPRPGNSAVIYHMALLRVADYLQIEGSRAPAVLLGLRDPQSPRSVSEWTRHAAVSSLVTGSNPRTKFVTVRDGLSLELFLQLRELLAGAQAEMDLSTAVLDEVYGARTDSGLEKLQLQFRRLESNLELPSFLDRLPFVPDQTGFSTDPRILTLMVEPLYGQQPSVGLRELMQNAVDAVNELRVWCETRGVALESLEQASMEPDVSFEYHIQVDGSCLLRVQDKGIGMTAQTIQNFFLRAGASFRHSPGWANDFIDDHGQPKFSRAGHFGIGAFAIFLLGNSFKLWTRHVTSESNAGFYLEVAKDSQLIPIQRQAVAFVGTKIEVKLSAETVVSLGLPKALKLLKEGKADRADVQLLNWFALRSPHVAQEIVDADGRWGIPRKFNLVLSDLESEPHFSSIDCDGLASVHWSFEHGPELLCNGIAITEPGEDFTRIDWSLRFLRRPALIVFDDQNRLPLTTQRYGLQQFQLPFETELARDVVLSFIAHALVCGPQNRDEAFFGCKLHPLSINRLGTRRFMRHDLLGWSYGDVFRDGNPVRWCTKGNGFFPSDPWFFSALEIRSQLVFGQLLDMDPFRRTHEVFPDRFSLTDAMHADAIVPWFEIVGNESELFEYEIIGEYSQIPLVLTLLTNLGTPFQAQEIIGAEVWTSVSEFLDVPSLLRKHKEKCLGYGDHPPETMQLEVWREHSPESPNRRVFSAKTTSETASNHLQEILFQLEVASGDSLPEALFVAELRTNPDEREPESLLAQVWNEFLGTRAIPFNPEARAELIKELKTTKPKLNRHITAWEKMDSSGSKWANLFEL